MSPLRFTCRHSRAVVFLHIRSSSAACWSSISTGAGGRTGGGSVAIGTPPTPVVSIATETAVTPEAAGAWARAWVRPDIPSLPPAAGGEACVLAALAGEQRVGVAPNEEGETMPAVALGEVATPVGVEQATQRTSARGLSRGLARGVIPSVSSWWAGGEMAARREGENHVGEGRRRSQKVAEGRRGSQKERIVEG